MIKHTLKAERRKFFMCWLLTAGSPFLLLFPFFLSLLTLNSNLLRKLWIIERLNWGGETVLPLLQHSESLLFHLLQFNCTNGRWGQSCFNSLDVPGTPYFPLQLFLFSCEDPEVVGAVLCLIFNSASLLGPLLCVGRRNFRIRKRKLRTLLNCSTFPSFFIYFNSTFDHL